MFEVLREPVRGRCVWTGEDMAATESWIYVLPKAAVDEIDVALRGVKQRGLSLFDVCRDDFPIPTLAAAVPTIQNELEQGRGFILLRGIPSVRYSVADCEMVFWGIGTHLGDAVSQNARGELLSHVIDQGLAFGAEKVRGYQTRSKLFFHNDNGDTVGLFCLQAAKSGGTSKLVSSAAIYNDILESHPEYIDELCRGYYYHMRGEQRRGLPEVTEHRVPVFSYHAGKLSSRYTRNSILLGEEHLGHPLSVRERAPLDLIDRLAEELCLDMELQPGDIQLCSNHAVLHARTDFVDYEEAARKRDLLRLWVNLPNGRPLTYEFATRYGPGSARRGVPPVL
ncbi:MAG: Taurine catabolism dioxygenase TauD, TfdA family [Betaproteobacteria bacterium]|nr:Taurine catabolism dioxygenase TauD, TfdA family [Betaproteobacteria bacterium]